MKAFPQTITFYAATLFFLAGMAVSSAQDVKERFTVHQAEINKGYERVKEAAGVQWLSVLNARIGGLQQAGDLEGLLAAKALKDQYAAEQSIPLGVTSKDPQIEQARLAYVKSLEHAEGKRSQSMTRLYTGYTSALTKQIKQLVQQGEVDRAIESKAELEAAQEQLAAYRAQLPAPAQRAGQGPAIRGPGAARLVRLHIDSANSTREVQLAELELYQGQKMLKLEMTGFSSEYNNSSWSHTKMIDGDPNTGWANADSQDNEFPHWFVFKTKQDRPFQLSRARLHTKTAGAGNYRIKTFSLYTSMDGKSWRRCLSGEIDPDKSADWEEFSCRPAGPPVSFD